MDVVLSGFGCSDGLCERFYTTLDGGLDVMLCWAPIMSATCIGVTRDHSRLLPCGFGSLVECARSWLVRMGSGRLPSMVLSNEFGSLGTNTDYGSYWGTLLGVADRGHGKFIPACGLLGGGL